MEYFRSGLKTVLGSQQDAQQPSVAETVERLIERVKTSTLLDDRRDACRALKALSKKFRLEVGAQCMDVLIRVLVSDRNDVEILGYALDAICNVITGSQDEEVEKDKDTEQDLGSQFTEIYIKKPENVNLLLDILEESDFRVRWPALKLLRGLLANRIKEVQESILVCPMGVSRLMDLLSDSREVIRNDSLLLLAQLTKGNANIQKIVAFENAFDRLLDIIQEEGYSDGSVVVEDCLLVMLTLLKNNNSNQTFFKEGSYLQKLTPFFDLQSDPSVGDKGWAPQKISNFHLMLQVLRTLVSPNNPQQVVSSCQKVMHQCGLLEQLCTILMSTCVSEDILTETINTVAEVIRGNHSNQEYFGSVTAPMNPPRPAIVVLLMSMVNEKQPFTLRLSVLYCFQCFLYRNELGQAQIIQTLLPSSADVTVITAGQMLCGGLFGVGPLSHWLASVALSHALVDNKTQKEQLLRVQLATSVGNPPVSLMKQCAMILQQGGKVQTRFGLLMLMCTWLAHCTLAVSHFLSIPTNVPFLTSKVALAEGDEHEDVVQGMCAFLLGICIEFNDNSQPGFTKDDLCQLIIKRIGLETFLDKLGCVSRNESYSRTAQNPHLKFKHPNEVMFEYEFCKLFKSLEGIIIKAVQPKPKEMLNGPESSMTTEQRAVLQQYKDLIREQDKRLKEMQQQLEELTKEHTVAKSEGMEMSNTIQQLRDQNALLKAQIVVNSNNGESAANQTKEVLQVQQNLQDLKLQCERLQEELKDKNEALERLKEDHQTNQGVAAEKQREEITFLKERIEKYEKEMEVLKNVQNEGQILQQQKTKLEEEKEELEQELDSIRKEQEDLLILLSEQETKISTYKTRLRELGEKIEDDDDEEAEEEVQDDDKLDKAD